MAGCKGGLLLEFAVFSGFVMQVSINKWRPDQKIKYLFVMSYINKLSHGLFYQIKGSTMGSKRYLLRKNRHCPYSKIMEKSQNHGRIREKSWNFILTQVCQPC